MQWILLIIYPLILLISDHRQWGWLHCLIALWGPVLGWGQWEDRAGKCHLVRRAPSSSGGFVQVRWDENPSTTSAWIWIEECVKISLCVLFYFGFWASLIVQFRLSLTHSVAQTWFFFVYLNSSPSLNFTFIGFSHRMASFSLVFWSLLLTRQSSRLAQ